MLAVALLSGCVREQAVAVSATKNEGAELRVLTLGDSITAMFRYQPFLREELQKESKKIVFVGNEGEGEARHEGHSGWSIGQIEDKTTQYISDARPDVVVLQIGINNMNHGLGLKGKNYPPFEDDAPAQGAQAGKTLDELGKTWGDKAYGSGYLTARVNGLLDKILTHPAAPLLVVAKIPGVGGGNPKWKLQNNDCDGRVREFNAILETAVEARQKKGLPVAIVDNYALGNREAGSGPEFTWGDQTQQSGDWVHPRPDAAAWKGMAANFAAGLQQLVKN